MIGLDTVGTAPLWIGFIAFVLLMLALDLGVFHRHAHVIRFREALAWSIVWVALALAFNVLVYMWFGSERALEFLTGYLLEKALSVDNIFVFLVIFSYFAVPGAFQHRVLFWGILGALIMRAVFIVLGAALIYRFHWIIYIFGAFLVFTGVKLLTQREVEVDPARNPLYRLFRRLFPVVNGYRGAHFFVREGGRLHATPLLLVLVVIEGTDLVFAVDSIPAVFAVTRDPFIVFTSNIFAILGLRAMFFLLANVMERFEYLKIGLALVLTYVGVKMLLSEISPLPIAVSLTVIAVVLGGSVAISLIKIRAAEGRWRKPDGAAPDREERGAESSGDAQAIVTSPGRQRADVEPGRERRPADTPEPAPVGRRQTG
jgi:tellurite resistance protein TerC